LRNKQLWSVTSLRHMIIVALVIVIQAILKIKFWRITHEYS
jgi:hypothetical protein